MNKESVLKYIKVGIVISGLLGHQIELPPEIEKYLVDFILAGYSVALFIEGKLKTKKT